MPIPKPRAGEPQSQFVSRCVSAISDEYDQEQAVAICMATYRDSKQLHCLNVETEDHKEWLFKAIDRRRQGFVGFASKQFEAALTKQFNQFYEELPKDQYQRNLERITEQPMMDAYQNVYQQVAGEFAARTYRNFKAHGLNLQTKQEEEEEDDDLQMLFFNAIKDFVAATLAGIVQSVTQTTRGDIRAIIRKLQQDPQLSLEQFQEQLKAQYAQVAAARGRLIGRTEIIRASNKGMLLAAAATNVPMRKVWLSTRDNRVRRPPKDDYDHWTPDGQTQALDEPFIVTGEQLMYPADPVGSLGNTINCRCTMSFQTV